MAKIFYENQSAERAFQTLRGFIRTIALRTQPALNQFIDNAQANRFIA